MSFNFANHSSSLICSGIDYFFSQTSYTVCISKDLTVYSFGNNEYGAHGHKERIIFPPKQIKKLMNITSISCTNFRTICLDCNGNVYSFGYNGNGRLGIGKDENELKQTHIPQKINIPPCKQISCGDDFTICVTEDNRLYSFGSNFRGELGLGNNIGRLAFGNNKNFPQLIPDLNNIEYIACGAYHCICKTYNNEYYSWGSNEYGQLGQGNNESSNKPIQCLNWPDNIIDIKCGREHSLLLTSEGQVYSFGFNKHGQLGLNDENIESINIPTLIKDIPEIQRIECGEYRSMCIDINDNLWLFGSNYFGELGLGDNENRYKPILHPTLSNIINISSGGKHTFVKTIHNKIYAFGFTTSSKLGTIEGIFQLSDTPTAIKEQLTPIQVFKDKEEIWCSTIGKSRAKSARK